MARRIGRWTADSRLFAIFGMGRARDDLANATSPWIAEREQQGKLGLHGAYFGISTGTLLALDEVSGRFEPVAAVRAHGAAVATPGS